MIQIRTDHPPSKLEKTSVEFFTSQHFSTEIDAGRVLKKDAVQLCYTLEYDVTRRARKWRVWGWWVAW